MINQIKQLKKWYVFRNLREKILFIGLCWAAIYAIFSFLFFNPLETRMTSLGNDIKSADSQISNWQIQLNALQQLSESNIYKQWLSKEKEFDTKKQVYRSLLRSSASIDWDDVIKSILYSDKSVSIEQIKNSKEEPYTIPDVKTSVPIYQQKLILIVYSSYFDTINYLNKLHAALPTIHWDRLSYEVQEYPIGKVEMEFSILYEKTT